MVSKITNWDKLAGKTIQKVCIHNRFDRDTVVLIFTDKSSAVLQTTPPEAQIELSQD